MNEFLKNPIICAIVERGIPLKITIDGFVIEGFYKSNEIKLKPMIDLFGFTAISRYNEKIYIKHFDDLVYLNYEWWKRSKNRFDGWKNPDPLWINDMVRLDLIKEGN